MKGLRTYLVAFLMALIPAATAYFEGFDWVGFLTSAGVPQQWVLPLAGVLASIVMAVMRSITSTPPAAKE
jgi:hypothetical protein